MGDDTASSKPTVLIVGGLGYIGRFLALHLHKNTLASDIRIVDKTIPQLAWLAPEFEDVCTADRVVQADAGREQMLGRIFDRKDGKEFDYVFNCGGEMRSSEDDEVYKIRQLQPSLLLGKEAAKRGVKCFVELSTGMVYKPDSVPRKETDTLKPWSKMAQNKLLAEEELAKTDGLKLLVLRLPHVYGPYSSRYIATALTMARVYQSLKQEMKFLWDKDLRINTIHVEDVARALWQGATWYIQGMPGWNLKWGSTPTFNVVDNGNTSQGTLEKILGTTFKISTGYQGTLINSFARLNLDHVVDEVNDEMLGPWAQLKEDAGIENKPNPLTPFMEKDLLKDTDLSLDGARFETVTGFKCDIKQLDTKQIELMIDSYKRMGWWP